VSQQLLRVLSHQAARLISARKLQYLLAVPKRPRQQAPSLMVPWPQTQHAIWTSSPPATLPFQVHLQAQLHDSARLQLATAPSATMWTPSAPHGRNVDGVREESRVQGGLQDLGFFRRVESMVREEDADTHGKHLHMSITCTRSSHLLWSVFGLRSSVTLVSSLLWYWLFHSAVLAGISFCCSCPCSQGSYLLELAA